MKFIVDAQLPLSLSVLLCNHGHDSKHTIELSEQNRTEDKKLIEISISESRVLISKDNDFLESFLLKGEPNKLILVRTGNISNTELNSIFAKHLNRILILLEENSLLEINKTEIIVHA